MNGKFRNIMYECDIFNITGVCLVVAGWLFGAVAAYCD